MVMDWFLKYLSGEEQEPEVMAALQQIQRGENLKAQQLIMSGESAIERHQEQMQPLAEIFSDENKMLGLMNPETLAGNLPEWVDPMDTAPIQQGQAAGPQAPAPPAPEPNTGDLAIRMLPPSQQTLVGRMVGGDLPPDYHEEA
jgi:hypothetical protein